MSGWGVIFMTGLAPTTWFGGYVGTGLLSAVVHLPVRERPIQDRAVMA